MLNIDKINSILKWLYTKKQIQSSIPYIKDICVDLQQQKYAIIKGIPLSVFCYHEVDIRPYHDIDILISQKGEALLNCYGLCEKERKEWKCDFKTRLESDDLYSLIRDDLNEHDLRKIAFNKRIFMEVTE